MISLYLGYMTELSVYTVLQMYDFTTNCKAYNYLPFKVPLGPEFWYSIFLHFLT